MFRRSFDDFFEIHSFHGSMIFLYEKHGSGKKIIKTSRRNATGTMFFFCGITIPLSGRFFQVCELLCVYNVYILYIYIILYIYYIYIHELH